MRKRSFFCFFVCLPLVLLSGCQGFGPHTAAGGAIGTAAGSLIGASIGSREGKAAEGALIGALTGATAGSVLGNQVDQEEARIEAQFQEAAWAAEQRALSFNQVIELSRSGLSDDVIVNQIRSSGIDRLPDTQDLIWLKNEGVSDRVIAALQQPPRPQTVPVPVPVAPFPECYPGPGPAPLLVIEAGRPLPPRRPVRRPHFRSHFHYRW